MGGKVIEPGGFTPSGLEWKFDQPKKLEKIVYSPQFNFSPSCLTIFVPDSEEKNAVFKAIEEKLKPEFPDFSSGGTETAGHQELHTSWLGNTSIDAGPHTHLLMNEHSSEPDPSKSNVSKALKVLFQLFDPAEQEECLKFLTADSYWNPD